MIYATIELTNGERFTKSFQSCGHLCDYLARHWAEIKAFECKREGV